MKRIISKKLHEQRFVHILIAFSLLCLPLFIDHNKFWEYHRSLYNFDLADEDDLFENHVTAAPTVSQAPSTSQAPSISPSTSIIPSNVPTSLPTSTPTSSPSLSPSALPSKSPSVPPSSSPSTRPTTTPTKIPSLTPTFTPTSTPSKVPSKSPSMMPSRVPSPSPSSTPSTSQSPSISFNPTAMISVPMTPFIVDMSFEREMTSVNAAELLAVMEIFLLDYIKGRLPDASDLVRIVLQRKENRHLRDLEDETSLSMLCSGEAIFSQRIQIDLPDTRIIDKFVLDAFAQGQSKDKFLRDINDTDSVTLKSVTDIAVRSSISTNSGVGQISIHVIVVVVGICLTLLGVGLSLAIRHSNKKAAQKRFEAMTANGNLFPELEDEVEKIVVMEPKPINISNDKEACERMMMRSLHNKSIAALANDKFRQLEGMQLSPREKSVGFAMSWHDEEESIQYRQNDGDSQYCTSNCSSDLMSVQDIEDYFAEGEDSSIDSSILSNDDGIGRLIPLGYHGVDEEASVSDSEIIIDPEIQDQMGHTKEPSSPIIGFFNRKKGATNEKD